MADDSMWPRDWQTALPLLVWVVLVLGFGLEAVTHTVAAVMLWYESKSYLSEILGAGVGYAGMVGLTAMLIHWARLREKFGDIRWFIAACMFASILLALSPYVEQHRWPFAWLVPPSAPVPPTAQENAAALAAIIRSQTDEIKQAITRQPPAPTGADIAAALAPAIKSEIGTSINQALTPLAPKPAPLPAYVNPIHSDDTKWRVAQNFQSHLQVAGHAATQCQFVIVRSQNYAAAGYPWDYSADFKHLFAVLGIHYDEKLTENGVQPEVQLTSLDGDTTASFCAATLHNALLSEASNKPGHLLGFRHGSVGRDMASDYLKNCGGGCVEIEIGSELK